MIEMVTIEEIKEIGQWGAREHMLEEARTFPYAGRVLRRVSPYFTKFFIEHNVSANQISFCSILLGIIGNLMFVFGKHYLILVGCLFYQFWNIFDLVDGEIARVTNVKTPEGKYLETINMTVTECGFIACLGVGLSKILDNSGFILLGLIFAVFICLLNYFARTRDAIIQELKKAIYVKKISPLRGLYKKARLFFVIFNGYVVLTIIVLFELLFPVKLYYYDVFGQTLNFLSTYFLLYGIIWVARTIVSSITNYRYIMKSQ